MNRILPHISSLSLAALIACGTSLVAQPDQRQNAILLEQQGNTTEAEAAWRAWTAAHPSDAEAFAHLGLLEARQENYSGAIEHYRKIAEEAPEGS